MSRRAFVLGALATMAVVLALPSVGCKKEERCAKCGMRIDRTSPWRAELVAVDGSVRPFDSPRCALRAWSESKPAVRSVRVQEYYDRTFRDANDVRFVVGGDVVGPMGPDLVPVEPARVTKYIQDHGADGAYALAEITTQLLDGKK